MASVVAPPRFEVEGKTLELKLPLWALIALAVVAAQALMATHIGEVLSSRAFFDTDDAMRAVQVRDLLAGQAWFDMTAWRLDPPQGVFSHWSRVVDTPLAGLQLFFRLFMSPANAELAARLVFPMATLTALFALMPWLARVLTRDAPQGVVVALAFLSGAVCLQFLPGRIDHHAPQIVLLTATLAFFMKGLEAGAARAMASAAATMALSIAISLENLPFFFVLLGGFATLFVLDGEKLRAPMLGFGGAALLAFPATFAATVAPSRYFLSACDAYSAVYFAAIMLGAAGLLALALLAPRLSSPPVRGMATAIAGAAVAAAYVAIAPQCVGDPLGGVDPLVRDLWLSHVTEATPLWKFWRTMPNVVIVTAAPVTLGLIAALVSGIRAEGLARRRWLLLAACIAMGLAGGASWQVRIFSSVTPFALVPLAFPVVALANRLCAQFSPLTRGLFAFVLCLMVTPIGLATALPAEDAVAAQGAAPSGTPTAVAKPSAIANPHGQACHKIDTLAPLAKLPPARVAASFDIGPYLLAYTPHSAFAGPYHRDNRGNRLVADAFLATPDRAEKILRDAGAQLVLWCQREEDVFVSKASEGLGAILARGETPAWLEKLPQSTKSLLVFAVRPKE
jgi:hypothetical protein